MGRTAQAGSSEPDDAELLALLLRAGSRASVGAGLADRLLQRFGSLRQVFDADSASLLAEDGIGSARLALLRAVPLLARRYFEQSLPAGACIRSPADTEAFLLSKLRHLGHERFCCMYLDNRHRVLRFDELFRGTIDGTSVYPREVVKEALSINAAAVILAHNHPSGVAEPSQADERITRRLKSALDLVDIRLLDHLIIGDSATTSLASRGLL
ncbi:MAG: DNA repair protein RadC [Gammaproteobacteria bacterium]|jgi:DNA repair protein RadC|nr:DNA repair protein RadC [Gammaproteobacteria bacterium]MDH3904705.1 DNA repair protein RadC [Gammaproteobacteria bacterium]MDH4003568.1 DNA repair protein RadC [Gammaproteobacteria bacterium]NCF60316.1 DNA repair protein RadC [Gammaproteobacteria bacterium]